MSARARGRAADGGHGFVLVGVVMLVLALTIIGISLYSLSGYESQFFGRTYADRVTLYHASGGLELVKKLVTSPIGGPAARLSSASLAIGREGIVSAIAWQDNPPDTTGPVNWNDQVHIRVGVSVFGATRTVEGTFVPTQQKNPYHNLFTVPGYLRYGDPGDPNVARAPVRFRTRAGGSWQNIPPGDTLWKSIVEFPDGPVPTEVGSAPSPNSAAFISAHLAGATLATMTTTPPPNPANLIVLDAGSGGATRFFRSPTSDPTAPLAERQGYDFVSQRALHVQVRGTAVWVVERGIRFNGGVVFERLNSGSEANLVIVAGPNARYPGEQDVGVCFLNGIDVAFGESERVNVFVVTHGSMKDKEVSGGASDNNKAYSICIFAQNYTMLPGTPVDPNENYFYRRYRTSMVGIADDLLERRLLPDPIGGIGSGLTLVPGTWTESPGLQ